MTTSNPFALGISKSMTAKSKLEWLGEKVTGEHNGFIQLKSGEFTVEDNRITEGTFVIDMSSMSNEDLKENKDKMEAMAKALLEWETIDADQINDIMAGKDPQPPADYSSSDSSKDDSSSDKSDKKEPEAKMDEPAGEH